MMLISSGGCVCATAAAGNETSKARMRNSFKGRPFTWTFPLAARCFEDDVFLNQPIAARAFHECKHVLPIAGHLRTAVGPRSAAGILVRVAFHRDVCGHDAA